MEKKSHPFFLPNFFLILNVQLGTIPILRQHVFGSKQMEQTLRAKVKIFFKSEKNAFNKKWWAYRVYIRQKKVGVAVIIYY